MGLFTLTDTVITQYFNIKLYTKPFINRGLFLFDITYLLLYSITYEYLHTKT